MSARFALSACLALLGSLGCNKPVSNDAPVPPASAAALQSSAPVPAASAKPWYAGDFSGEYQAKTAPVQVPAGALKEWSRDDGKLSNGPGKLSLKIDDAGLVEGMSEGALGAGQVTGKVEENTLRVQLLPADDKGLHGVLVATREGDGFKGSIEASSGDSLQVRTAAIELQKSPH